MIEIFVEEPTSEKCGEQEETAEDLLFDWISCLGPGKIQRVQFGVQECGILQENNMTICIRRYCRLVDLTIVPSSGSGITFTGVGNIPLQLKCFGM